MFNQKLRSLDKEIEEYPNLAAQMRELKKYFTNDSFTPSYTNITNVSSADGHYQRIGSLVYVQIRFVSNGSLAVASNATITLPLKPYTRSGSFPYADSMWWISGNPGNTRTQCYMDSADGKIKPVAAIAATANHQVLTGFYYAE